MEKVTARQRIAISRQVKKNPSWFGKILKTHLDALLVVVMLVAGILAGGWIIYHY